VVAQQVEAAIEREQETGERKLFPIWPDEFVESEAFPHLAEQKLAAGEWHEAWVRRVREQPAADFRNWQDETTYRAQLDYLLQSLRGPAAA
jgi:hypothetical protein